MRERQGVIWEAEKEGVQSCNSSVEGRRRQTTHVWDRCITVVCTSWNCDRKRLRPCSVGLTLYEMKKFVMNSFCFSHVFFYVFFLRNIFYVGCSKTWDLNFGVETLLLQLFPCFRCSLTLTEGTKETAKKTRAKREPRVIIDAHCRDRGFESRRRAWDMGQKQSEND